MQIWVDAHSCPKAVKEILFRAANRTETLVTLVANQSLFIPPSRYIKMLRVQAGYDLADNEIFKQLQKGDLVITADIPLANDVLEKGGHAINPRGELYTFENIKERLNVRDFMETLRHSGIQEGGLSPQNARDIQNFANQLNAFLIKHKK